MTTDTITSTEISIRMTTSAEGRFTILDEQSKDSEGFDENTDSDFDEKCFSRTYGPCQHQIIKLQIKKPKLTISHTSLPPMRLNGSQPNRLRVSEAPPPPPPRKYKRGRFEVYEWYPSDIYNNNNKTATMTYESGTKSLTINKKHNENHPPLLHEKSIFTLDPSDESDRENLPEFSKSPPNNSNLENNYTVNKSTPIPINTSDKKQLLNTQTKNGLYATSPDFLSGRVTPLEMSLHYGLERSLSGNGGSLLSPYSFENRIGSPQNNRGSSVPPPDRASQMHKAGSPSTAQTSINHGELTSKKQKTFDVNNLILLSKESFLLSSAGNAGNSQIVAIDSKIEQAMDLVKTHLMFAVREEVEILRNKILQLETTVIQLEAENAILREHVPAEVLQNLNGTSTQPTKPQTTYVTAQ